MFCVKRLGTQRPRDSSCSIPKLGKAQTATCQDIGPANEDTTTYE